MIWLTSDWHYDHDKDFIVGARKYATVAEMNDDIVLQTNKYVQPKDLLIHNGDVAMGQGRDDERGYVANIQAIFAKINCKNVLWVGGNHDRLFIKKGGELVRNLPLWRLFRWRSQCVNCFQVYLAKKAKCPHCGCGDYEPVEGIYPMGLELRLSDKLRAEHGIPDKFKDILLTCTHYSHRVWNKSHHNKKQMRSVNFYGHSHAGLPGIFCSHDVGWDVFRRPVSVVEMLEDVIPKHNASEHGQTYFGHHDK